MGLPRAPQHLSEPARRWWRSVVRDYDLESHELQLLTAAAECLDRVEECRAIIDKEGLTYVDRFGQPKPRPEISIERLQRLAFARLVKSLDLDGDVPPPPSRRKHPRRH